MIAIGFPGLGDLKGKNRDLLKELLAAKFGFEGIKLRNTAAVVDLFVNKMAPGDWVVCPNGNDIYIGEVTGDYHYDAAKDNQEEGYPHQREVKWLNKDHPVLRVNLPESLRSSLKGWLTVTNLGDYRDELSALLAGKPLPARIELTEATAAGEVSDWMENPHEVSDDELLIRAKGVLLEELNSDDPERRLTAAIEILQHYKS